VLFADLDNDGDLDLYLGNMLDPTNNHVGCTPLRNDAWAVNDFPTAADRAIADSGSMFEKVNREKKVVYTVLFVVPFSDDPLQRLRSWERRK